jgi:hypothetical protein
MKINLTLTFLHYLIHQLINAIRKPDLFGFMTTLSADHNCVLSLLGPVPRQAPPHAVRVPVRSTIDHVPGLSLLDRTG